MEATLDLGELAPPPINRPLDILVEREVLEGQKQYRDPVSSTCPLGQLLEDVEVSLSVGLISREVLEVLPKLIDKHENWRDIGSSSDEITDAVDGHRILELAPHQLELSRATRTW